MFTASMWDEGREQLMKVEESAFEGKGFDEGWQHNLVTDPKNTTIILRDSKTRTIIGYTNAQPAGFDTAYITSTAILPEYQGKGLVKYLICFKGFKCWEWLCR